MVLKGHGLMKNVGGEEKPVKESGVKRTYVNREAVVNRRNDDDDFVDPPPQIYEPTKKPKAHESTPQLEGKFVDRYFAFTGEILKTRIATSNLVTWFEKLNADQRKTVIEMGFGPVLNLKLGRIPTALGFWLVQNYNEHDMTLNVGNQVIHITPKLVSELMGIPNGRIAIEGNKTRGKDTVVVEWRSQYKNTTWIKRPLVRGFFSRAMTMKDAGRKFMLNFLVGFFTVVGETNENSVINQKFLPSVKKGVNVCELGWCDYVIRCLNRSKASWDPTSRFNGPLLLLAWLSKLKNGKVCEVISAAKCIYADSLIHDYTQKSRFSNVIKGGMHNGFTVKVTTQFLSPKARYTVSLVFKHNGMDDHETHIPFKFKVGEERYYSDSCMTHVRGDGWLMIQLYQFTSYNREDDLEIQFLPLFDITSSSVEYFLEGIEFRPVQYVS